jgi:hypothetical protein
MLKKIFISLSILIVLLGIFGCNKNNVEIKPIEEVKLVPELETFPTTEPNSKGPSYPAPTE